MMRHGKLEDSFMGPAIYCEGEEHIEAAWEADTDAKRASAARRALKKDLDNIDGYILLSHGAKTLAERIALLAEAVRVGDRLWAPLLDEPEMEWWGFVGTRPYMRALHELALAREEAGDTDEAEALYRRLLQLNPNDNQGVRALLIRRLMARGRVGDLRALLKVYKDDMLLEPVMAELWLALRRKDADMARLGPDIEARNPHVLPALAGEALPDDPDASPFGIAMGGPEEAAIYAEDFAAFWPAAHRAQIRAYLDTRPAP